MEQNVDSLKLENKMDQATGHVVLLCASCSADTH